MDLVKRQAVDAVHVAALAGRPVRDLGAAAMLDLLAPETLDPIDLVDYLRAVERVEAALAARKVRGIAAVADAYEAAGMTAMEARHEVGAALRLSPVTASDRTAVAVDLRNRFPAPWPCCPAGTSAGCRPRTWPAAPRTCPTTPPGWSRTP